MSDPLSKAAYDAAIRDHANKVESELKRLDAMIERGATDNTASCELARLQTTRVLLGRVD